MIDRKVIKGMIPLSRKKAFLLRNVSPDLFLIRKKGLVIYSVYNNFSSKAGLFLRKCFKDPFYGIRII
jgi:hypothetical protein